MSDQMPSLEFFDQIFGGAWITQGLSVAAELGIADLLTDQSLSAQELAAKCGADPGALYRLLRALAGVGVFEENENGEFALTPLAELLRSDAPGSQRALAIMMGSEFHAAWGELLHSVRTGEAGFHNRFGKHIFQYLEERPDRHLVYDAAMESVHGRETEAMLNAYDFSAFGTVVDIGGGNGSMLCGILRKYPEIQGILFDLPSVAERSQSSLAGSSLADRLQIQGGDFFAAVPPGGDAYLLRHILHDWLDPEAVTILRRCREAMTPNGKLLAVEMVLPLGNEPSFGKWLDLMMLLVSGRERTEKEYGHLFSESGLKLTRVIRTSSDISVVEGMRAA